MANIVKIVIPPPNFMKDMNINIQEAQKNPTKMNSKESMPRPIKFSTKT